MKKGGIVLIAAVIIVLAIPLTLGMFVYWLYNFKIHIFLKIIEVYHYNRIQEVPLALISSDFGSESFVEKVNKVYYNLSSSTAKRMFIKGVKETIKKQIGEAYKLDIRIDDIEFGMEEYEECTVFVSGLRFSGFECKCTDKCPLQLVIYIPEKVVIDCEQEAIERGDESYLYECLEMYCSQKLPLEKCFGEALNITITYFRDTFPFPLVFNGSNFVEKMWFEAYG